MNGFAPCPNCGQDQEPRMADVARCSDCGAELFRCAPAASMDDAKARNSQVVQGYLQRLRAQVASRR